MTSEATEERRDDRGQRSTHQRRDRAIDAEAPASNEGLRELDEKTGCDDDDGDAVEAVEGGERESHREGERDDGQDDTTTRRVQTTRLERLGAGADGDDEQSAEHEQPQQRSERGERQREQRHDTQRRFGAVRRPFRRACNGDGRTIVCTRSPASRTADRRQATT